VTSRQRLALTLLVCAPLLGAAGDFLFQGRPIGINALLFSIAFVASLAAYRGLPYAPGYSASKAGLRAYGEALRAQLEPHGIGVTVVCPGFFASPMTARWNGPTPLLVSTERAARRIKRGIDRGRRRVSFPWPLVLGMRLADALPAVLGDRILRGFRFRIRAA